MPAADSNSLQGVVDAYDEWQAARTAAALKQYATLVVRQGQLKQAMAAGTHWFEHPEAPGFIEAVGMLAGTAALPAAESNSLQEFVAEYDEWQAAQTAAALKQYATLVVRQEDLMQAMAAGTHWFEHPEAPEFIAAVGKLAGTAALPAADSNSLQGVADAYDEWQAARTAAALKAIRDLVVRQEELKQATAAGTHWFEHPEAPEFIAAVGKLAGTAALPAAESNSLQGVVDAYDEWQAARTAAALKQYATLVVRQEDLMQAMAAGTHWFEHPEAPEFIAAVGKLAGTAALPAAESNSLAGIVAEYDEWQASRAAAALERYATLMVRQEAAQAGGGGGGRDSTGSSIRRRPGSSKLSGKLAGTAALPAAENNSLARDRCRVRRVAGSTDRGGTQAIQDLGRRAGSKRVDRKTRSRTPGWYESDPNCDRFGDECCLAAGSAR